MFAIRWDHVTFGRNIFRQMLSCHIFWKFNDSCATFSMIFIWAHLRRMLFNGLAFFLSGAVVDANTRNDKEILGLAILSGVSWNSDVALVGAALVSKTNFLRLHHVTLSSILRFRWTLHLDLYFRDFIFDISGTRSCLELLALRRWWICKARLFNLLLIINIGHSKLGLHVIELLLLINHWILLGLNIHFVLLQLLFELTGHFLLLHTLAKVILIHSRVVSHGAADEDSIAVLVWHRKSSRRK